MLTQFSTITFSKANFALSPNTLNALLPPVALPVVDSSCLLPSILRFLKLTFPSTLNINSRLGFAEIIFIFASDELAFIIPLYELDILISFVKLISFIIAIFSLFAIAVISSDSVLTAVKLSALALNIITTVKITKNNTTNKILLRFFILPVSPFHL